MINEDEIRFMVEAARRCLQETPKGNVPYLAVVVCEPDAKGATPVQFCAGSALPERTDKEGWAKRCALRDVVVHGFQPAKEPALIWLSSLKDFETNLRSGIARLNSQYLN